jgi:hypothetical protein
VNPYLGASATTWNNYTFTIFVATSAQRDARGVPDLLLRDVEQSYLGPRHRRRPNGRRDSSESVPDVDRLQRVPDRSRAVRLRSGPRNVCAGVRSVRSNVREYPHLR